MQIAEELGVARTTVTGWLSTSESLKIKDAYESSNGGARKRLRGSTHDALDLSLYDWFKQQRASQIPMAPVMSFIEEGDQWVMAFFRQNELRYVQPGNEADFVVLDPKATPLLARKTAQASSLDELLFALIVLGDDRVIERTVIAGR